MAKLSNEELLSAFEEMTLLELSEFVKLFEEKFDVTAAAPAAVVAAAPAGGGGGGGAQSRPSPSVGDDPWATGGGSGRSAGNDPWATPQGDEPPF